MQILVLSFLFITLYGSGFVATQLGLDYIDPLLFLILRFTLTTIILFSVCFTFKLKLASSIKDFFHQISVLMSVCGLIGLTLGTLYHKRFCSSINIFAAGAVQNIGALAFCLLIGSFYGERYVEWNPSTVFSLLWMAIGVSVGALSVLYVLIRELEISKVSSLFYLVPVSSVLISLVVFSSQVSQLELFGVLITSIAVFLINIKPRKLAAN